MISDKPFDITSGDKNVFQSDLPIKSESFCRVFIDTSGTGTWEIVDESLYQVIMDSVVFTVSPTGTYLVLQVATVITELLNSPTDISMVLAMRDEIKDIGANINVIQVVGDNMTAITEVKDSLPKIIIINDNIAVINTVGDNIDDINTYANTYYFSLDVEPNITTHPTLTEGDLYFDNALKEIKVYDGSTWLRAYSGDIYTKGEVDDLNRRVPIKVKATEDINKGDVIMATEYNSGEDAINVTKTINQTDIAVGIANVSISNGGFGDVITRGLIEGVDMSGYNFGDILYSNGVGGFTITKPAGAYQAIGFVLKNVINGALMVDFTEPVDSYTKSVSDLRFAKIGGDVLQKFKVADAVNADEAVSKAQLDNSLGGVGIGQAWVDEKANRVIGTTYTNTSTTPIQLSIAVIGDILGAYGDLFVDGLRVGRSQQEYDSDKLITFPAVIVPPNSTFLVDNNYGVLTINSWFELK